MANLHKLQEFALLATGTSKLARGDLGAQQGSPDALCFGIRRVESCLFFFFFVLNTSVYFKKRKEGTAERKCLFGDFFFLSKRWFRHMNENETLC